MIVHPAETEVACFTSRAITLFGAALSALVPGKSRDGRVTGIHVREVSPISSAHVSAVIGPTPGTVRSRLSLSSSSGSRSSDRSSAASMRMERSMSWRIRYASGPAGARRVSAGRSKW